MTEHKLASKLFFSLPKPDQSDVIVESGLDIGPFRSFGIDRLELSAPDVAKISPPILRRIDISNEDFASLFGEAGLDLGGFSPPSQVSISFPRIGPDRGEIRLNEMTAVSAFVCEIALRTAEVLDAIHVQEELDPPDVQARVGSVSLSLGGGTLLTAGIGLVIAAHTGLLHDQAPLMAEYGGAISAFFGVVDLAVNWYRTIKDAQKLESETVLNKLKADELRGTLHPASTLVEPTTVVADSRQFGLNAILGTHLLNKVLPSCLELGRTYSPVAVSHSGSSSKASVRAASASAGD